MKGVDGSSAEPGLHLVVEFEGGGLRVLRAAPIPAARRLELRPPLLSADTAPQFTAATSEIVLAILHKDGRILDHFGWSTRSEAFFDRPIPKTSGGIQGSPGDSRQTVRILRIPVSAEAAFLDFYRSDLTFSIDSNGERIPSLATRRLALYYLGEGPPPPVPPLPIPAPEPPLPLPWVGPWKPWAPPRSGGGGYIVDARTLLDNGPPGHRFDIVILGDGFQDAELCLFDSQALYLCNGLLAMPPFDALAHLINVHVVRTVSCDSGVDNCPKLKVPKNTYYDVEGDFLRNGYPGFFGIPTSSTWKVWEAAEMIAPLHHIDLMVMLANVQYSGGSAFPDQDLAFLGFWPTQKKFIDIGAHECCHVSAKAAEEYIGCEPPDPCKTYPNRATAREVAAKLVGWRSLALRRELQRGDFKAVHKFGDPFDSHGQPVMPALLEGMLGLYWGCQDIDPSIPAIPKISCDPWQDPRGATFYRAMAECRMRKSTFEFCRVCSRRMMDVVRLASL